ncbi:MAG: helix-turn-helix domain-containing protein [Paracoccaceae bacterium]
MKPATILAPESAPLSVGILLMEETNALSLAAVVDPMRVANRRTGRNHYAWRYYSVRGGPVRLTAGIEVPTEPLGDRIDCDLLILVASFRIAEQSTPAFLARLRRLAPQVRAMAAVDGAAWFLARAGLLNGTRATVHWEDLEAFTADFPAIDVRRDRYVISGDRITTGGAAPSLDFMLDLIRARQGAELALSVAGTLLYDPVHTATAPQRTMSAARIARADPALGRAVALMEAAVEDPPPVAEIARRIGLSARRMEMLFRARLGTSPGRFFLDLRLEEARRMVTDSRLPLQEIALRTGFSGQAAFARAFRARFGSTATALRAGRGQ